MVDIEDKMDSFLPAIYDILKFMDKDPSELGNKVAELKQQFQTAKDDIEKLPGIETSPDEQRKHMDALRRQLIAKIELLTKYKSLNIFDTPPADDEQ